MSWNVSGLPEVDISNIQLLQKVEHKLKIPLDNIIQIWSAIGSLIMEEYTKGRGFRIERLGTFTSTIQHHPVFVFAEELLNTNRIRYVNQPHSEELNSKRPTCLLNYARLAKVANTDRNVCEKVVKTVIEMCYYIVSQQHQSCSLAIFPVGEMIIAGSSARLTFAKEFLEKIEKYKAQITNDNVQVVDSKKFQPTERTRLVAKELAKLPRAPPKPPKSPIPQFSSRNPLSQMEYVHTSANKNQVKQGLFPKKNKNSITSEIRKRNGISTPASQNIDPYESTLSKPRSSHGNDNNMRKNSSLRRNNSIISKSEVPNSTKSNTEEPEFTKGRKISQRNNIFPQLDNENDAAIANISRRRSSNLQGYSNSSNNIFNLDLNDAINTKKNETPLSTRSNRSITSISSAQTNSSSVPSSRSSINNIFSPPPEIETTVKQNDITNLKDLLDRLRRKLIERGGPLSFRGLRSVLKVMDTDGDHKLSKDELYYGLRNFGILIQENELQSLMDYLDVDRSGHVSLEEFLRGIKGGEMNKERMYLVERAFSLIDHDNDDHVTVEELKQCYDASQSHEVLSGKKTADQVMREFMQVWDKNQDGIITKDEFITYYEDLSLSIDRDDYFELMMRNSWHLAGGEGWAENSSNLRVLATYPNGDQAVEMIHNDLGLNKSDKKAVLARLRKQGSNAISIDMLGKTDEDKDMVKTAKPMSESLLNYAFGPQKNSSCRDSNSGATFNIQKQIYSSGEVQNNVWYQMKEILYTPPKPFEDFVRDLQASQISENPMLSLKAFTSHLKKIKPEFSVATLLEVSRQVDPRNTKYVNVRWLHNEFARKFGKDPMSAKPGSIIERVRSKVISRIGENGGLKSLTRLLAIFDDNGDGKLDRLELKYGLQQIGCDLNTKEIESIFTAFDLDGSGFIELEEFLRGIKGGNMTERRRALVETAFSVMDEDDNGYITLDEMEKRYDASQSHEVLAGTKTVDDVMREFIQVWDQNRDGTVSKEEFLAYYENLGLSIDSDDYFELMIRNSWHLSGGEGACENSTNLRVLVTYPNGTQTVEEVKNDLGLNRGDIKAIMERLHQQGVNASNVSVLGSIEEKEKDNVYCSDTIPLSKEDAASKLQCIFRNKKAKDILDTKKRMLRAKNAALFEEEKNKSRAPIIRRTALRGTYGF